MDKRIAGRIVKLQEETAGLHDEAGKVIDGISGWTREEDYVQLRLLIPRLKNLVLKLCTNIQEAEACIKVIEGDKNAEAAVALLLQLKAQLVKEKMILEKLQGDISLSTRIIESSEKARLSGEILERCKAFALSVEELE